MVDLTGLTILVVNSDSLALRKLKRALKSFGASVLVASELDAARTILTQERIQAMLVDANIAEKENRAIYQLLQAFHTLQPNGFFYLLTDADAPIAAVNVQSQGIHEVIKRPIHPEQFAQRLFASFSKQQSERITPPAVIEQIQSQTRPYFLFRSNAMRLALANLPAIARSEETVLVTGETGSGKEIVSRAVHLMSYRAHGPFIAVNSGAIPEGLIEGELFGHEKGAFTGAYRSRKGKFELANEGTLFLDEIGDMPQLLQVRLLRILEDREMYRVGAESPIPINVRVIAATRRDLEKDVEEGLFREDLYYRLNVFSIYLPPLRQRVEDIAFLAMHFLERTFLELSRPQPHPRLSVEAIQLLETLPWKGNVRELRNIMTRVAAFLPSDAPLALPAHILPHIREKDYRHVQSQKFQSNQNHTLSIPLGIPLQQVEETYIQETLKLVDGNRTKAAKILGLSLRTLRRKLNRPTEEKNVKVANSFHNARRLAL
jgi:DNA-binding NtrC family response regulator